MTYLNPYLFLLLKKIIEIEITLDIDKKPSIEVISHGIVDRRFPPNSSTKEGVRDKIRKLWSKQVFDFSATELDIVAEYPDKLVKSFSWDHFCQVQGIGAFARKGETFRAYSYDALRSMEHMHIASLVAIQSSELFLRYEKVTRQVSSGKFKNVGELHYVMYDTVLLPKFEKAYGLAPNDFNHVDDYLDAMEDFRKKLKREAGEWLNEERA